MWKNRSKAIFVSSFCCAAFVLFQMAMYAGHMLFDWDTQWNLFQICGYWLRSVGFYWLVYVLNALVALTFARYLWLFGQQLYAARSIRAKLEKRRNAAYTRLLNERVLSGRGNLMVVAHPQPVAFTMGLARPCVIVSDGLVDMLDREELEAVLHHEMYHLAQRDPLKTFLLQLFASVLWYLPILRWCHQQYKIARELLADHYAIEAMGSPAALGSALLKLLKRDRQHKMAFAHVSFADTAIDYRIRQILDPQAKLPLRLPLKSVIVSLQVLFILSALLLVAVR